MGGRQVARARIQSLFNLIDAIKYTKSTMVDDHCAAQWSHKFVHVCMCFGGFLVFFPFVIYKKYSAFILGEKKKMVQLGCETKTLSPIHAPPPPKD